MEKIRGILVQTSNIEQVTLQDGSKDFIVSEKSHLIQSFTDFERAKKIVSYLVTNVIMNRFDNYGSIDIHFMNRNHEEKDYIRFCVDTLAYKYEVRTFREYGREYEVKEVKHDLKQLHNDVWTTIEDLKQYLID